MSGDKKTIEITFKAYGNEYKARFWQDVYMNNGNFYVGIITWNEELGYWENWGDLTVNLGLPIAEKNRAFLDTNNVSANIISVLKEKGYVKETGITSPSGFCIYPLVEFSEEFIDGLFEDV